MTGGATLRIGTYQDDHGFGLHIKPGSIRTTDHWDGIYRYRALTELPTGLVQDVSVHLDVDTGILAEAKVRIADHDLHLMAGEAEKTRSGALIWRTLDESVLVFTDASRVEEVTWAPSRGRLRRLG